MKIEIEINSDVINELNYIVELHKAHRALSPMTNIEQLINYILAHIADGSRRPGSWERGLLESMGLIAECQEHRNYRTRYGKPNAD